MTGLDILIGAVALAIAFFGGWLANTAITEHRHDCMPHDPHTCADERRDADGRAPSGSLTTERRRTGESQ